MNEPVYAGFWIRVGASIIDSILILVIIIPLLMAVYGTEYLESEAMFHGFWDVFFNYVAPAVAIIVFWYYKSATPGKMALRLTIVDADTGSKPTLGQCVGRYLGYFVSTIPLCLGLIWVAFDKKKQGWHDKLAGTVVIRNREEDQAAGQG